MNKVAYASLISTAAMERVAKRNILAALYTGDVDSINIDQMSMIMRRDAGFSMNMLSQLGDKQRYVKKIAVDWLEKEKVNISKSVGAFVKQELITEVKDAKQLFETGKNAKNVVFNIVGKIDKKVDQLPIISHVHHFSEWSAKKICQKFKLNEKWEKIIAAIIHGLIWLAITSALSWVLIHFVAPTVLKFAFNYGLGTAVNLANKAELGQHVSETVGKAWEGIKMVNEGIHGAHKASEYWNGGAAVAKAANKVGGMVASKFANILENAIGKLA